MKNYLKNTRNHIAKHAVNPLAPIHVKPIEGLFRLSVINN